MSLSASRTTGAPARGERITKYNRQLEIVDSNPDLPYGLT
jgi:enolase